MSKAAITISRSVSEDQGYAVRVPGSDHMNRIFLWGTFDEGTVSWQTARAQAVRYAMALASGLKRPIKVASAVEARAEQTEK